MPRECLREALRKVPGSSGNFVRILLGHGGGGQRPSQAFTRVQMSFRGLRVTVAQGSDTDWRSKSTDEKVVRRLDWHKCEAEKRFPVLKQSFKGRMSSAFDPSWMKNVDDPLMEADEEMRGITWFYEAREICCRPRGDRVWNYPNSHGSLNNQRFLASPLREYCIMLT